MPTANAAATIDTILNPRRIAIVGASKDPAKRGYRAIKTLLADNYAGEIIPINPKETEILGLRCYPTLMDVPGHVDVALIYTPASTVPAVIEQCGRSAVTGAVVIAGGFSEASEEGRLLEERVVEIAKRYNVRVAGPNISGIFGARYSFNAINWYNLPRGGIAVLSNSSNVGLSLAVEAQTYPGAVGFSTIVAVGNQADIQFHEYLASLGSDPGTRVILSYVEGFKFGRAYLDAAKQVALQKPIVAYKAGRNAEGVRLARSHSGSLAGDYRVTRSVLRQAGVTVVDRSDQLFPVAEALCLLPLMKSRRVAVVSEGGGPITIAAEALVERGMVLTPLSEQSQRQIQALLPGAFCELESCRCRRRYQPARQQLR